MIANYFSNISLLQVLISIGDILLVWLLVYTGLRILIGTRGIQLVKGIFVIIFLKVVLNIIGFKTMSYIVDQLVTWGVLAIIIIFQPEIRRTLEHLGRFDIGNILFNRNNDDAKHKNKVINMLTSSTRHMARRRIGALIVLENNTGLDEYVERGIVLNSEISSELIINLFIPNTPLHDGAVIINKDKIRSASSMLPLTDNRNIDSKYGTRHRAAIGLSELTDAIIIVVSEETGIISAVHNNKFVTDFTEEKLKVYLEKNWLVTNSSVEEDK
ncbi:TIGR00159 family protein [Gemella sp. GH3]|uniref:diadenylate cyclase CdaA n=1 Tax=unclassified Gemella TaxID=2624949 RepID=UPI0015CFB751|nr:MULTISPECIES: diadenylate cyclase CdaA [unclassified Gemella]MBF0713592.1 TIGR00159 family protein [Gemella sp. GH3.1]NYS50544.1 TIGR00159 family protein [Gemella sp. GH3]